MTKILPITLIGTLILPCAQAAEWSLSNSVNTALEYDDNIFMRDDNKLGDYHASMTPTVKVAYALENTETSLSTGYVLDRYERSRQLDTDNPFWRFDTHYKTGRSSWQLNASYVESTSRSEAAEDTGDFETNSISTTESISPKYNYQLTERDVVSLSASYSTKEYSTTDFNNSRHRSLSTQWQHKFTERLNGGVSLSADNNKSTGLINTSDDDTYNISLTSHYNVSQIWAMNGSVGYRLLNSQQTDGFGFKETTRDTGPSLDLTISYKGALDTASIALSRSISPSSIGQVNEQDKISLSWSRALSERLSVSMIGSYQTTTSAIDNGDDKRENINISPSISWKLSPDASVGLSYKFRQQKESLENSDASSQAVMLTLNYDWDGFRASR